MKRFQLLILFLVTLIGSRGAAQDFELQSTVEVYQDLKKLERGLRVLYVAAHPDDENTRLIAWLENEKHIETAYLSLTRGQGGQNLIGDEKGDALGVIRTYELLEARKIDGGEQLFTRAVDFGYSKSAKESFEKWGKKEVLGDVVYAIRKFRPHVIITRFPPDRNAGHGHHEASALLAEEAFDMAADPKAYPEHLDIVDAWQPTAMYFNSSSWWRKELEDMTQEQLEAENTHRVNIGVYNALTGLAINEIASLARSKHRCQAFGTNRDRGERFEYLKQLKGEWDPLLFDGLVGIWENSPEHQAAITTVVEGFDFTNRAANLIAVNDCIEPKLAQRNMWANAEDIAYVNKLMNRVKQDLMGVRIEVFAGKDPIVVGTPYEVTIQAFNANEEEAMVRFTHTTIDTTVLIASGQQIEWQETLTAPKAPSTPYWLRKAHGNLYDVSLSEISGLPKLYDELISYSIRGKGRALGETEVHRKWRDRSIGEIIQPMVFVPIIALDLDSRFVILKSGEVQPARLHSVAFEDLQNLRVGISSIGDPEVAVPIDLSKGQEKNFGFSVSSGSSDEPSFVKVEATCIDASGKEHLVNQSLSTLDYDHIPNIQITTDCEMKVVTVELEELAGKILYLEGSGDEVDEAMEKMGYYVIRGKLGGRSVAEMLEFDAVVCGIRSLNKNEDLASNVTLLHEYAKRGGKVIVQYNTSYGLLEEKFAPYDLTLSRNRVTEEDADAKLIDPKHPLFSKPHKIKSEDFDNWVQERGLYFAGEWDDRFKPMISWSDKGEEDVNGALLIAKYGRGEFIYTGISFFRQLPAGVPGAYRLFANLIEY